MTDSSPRKGRKDRVFRDPVHGLIEFRGNDRPIADLLDTRAMQRLRRIKQMGWAWLVYPGAEHSRFGHALGAYHIAQRVTARLGLDEEIARHVKVAALMHDIGHGPFSHAWEHVFGDISHEQWGIRMVAEDPELRAALLTLGGNLPDVLTSFWNKTYRPQYVRKLVSSQLDVDRLDYLLRDGHYSGAGYATYDLDWIIHALQVAVVRADDPDPTDLVVDYRRGMYAVEQYLFARSYMYAQVYHHKTVRAAEWMFIKCLGRFAELARAGTEPPGLAMVADVARGNPASVDDYLSLHDARVMLALDGWAGHGAQAAADPVLRDLADRLTARRLFKTLDLGDDPRIATELAPRLAAIAEEHFGASASYYWHIDTARQIGYQVSEDDELHVVDHPRYPSVTLSRLLQDMPLGQPTSAVRLVFARELAEQVRPLVAAATK